MGLKIPPSGNMTLGKTVDSALDFNYKFKIVERKDRKTNEVLDFYSTEFDQKKPDTEWKEDEDPGEVKDNGVRVLTEYQETVSPKLQPIMSQKEVGFNIPDLPVPIVGFIDVIDDQYTVIDNKVKGKSPSKDKDGLYLPTESEKVQMSIYSLGLHEEGIKPKELRIDSMVTNKKPLVVQAKVIPTSADKSYLIKVIEQMSQLIALEIFMPNRQGNMCSRKNCGFADHCMKEFGGTVK
jgi:CRISPR/Cas system-associated exonuclease Cas4 (RecB family)